MNGRKWLQYSIHLQHQEVEMSGAKRQRNRGAARGDAPQGRDVKALLELVTEALRWIRILMLEK